MPKRRRAKSRQPSAAEETDSKANDNMDIDAGDGAGGEGAGNSGGGGGGGGGDGAAAKKQETSVNAAAAFLPDSAELVTALCAVGHSAFIPDISAVVAAYAVPGPLQWRSGGRVAHAADRQSDSLSLPLGQCPRRIAMRLTFPPSEPDLMQWRRHSVKFEGSAPGFAEKDLQAHGNGQHRGLCSVWTEFKWDQLRWFPWKAHREYSTPRVDVSVVLTIDPLKGALTLTANGKAVVAARWQRMCERHLMVTVTPGCTLELLDP
jgi:hypothetical protein